MPRELPKAYDPAAIEDRWAEYWVKERLFDIKAERFEPSREFASSAPPFTILLPPPNVTGRLHMGHMFEQTETDILIRWHRMSGDLALWVPGTDHAGIATQMMVERQLATEGTSRQKLGREAFLERVWQWKQLYGGAILDQMKRLGASVDWSREYFTMDENLSVAVKEAFVRLHEQGLIYRGAYIVNWCPGCQTAISDLEVVHEEQKGSLWEIRYEVVEEPGTYLTIATTRPETMLGDTAVAVHPEDERYLHLHGKRLRLPLVGREIPIITDDWVSRDFGTGAVKVTPAHDPNDFALGQRHGLPSINVMDETAHINAEGGVYAGLDRYEARKRIVADLEVAGLSRRHQRAYQQRRPLRPLERCRRAAPVHAMVRENPAARRQGHRRRRAGLHQDRPGSIPQDLHGVDAQHPRLVHLAAALVGPSHSRMALRDLQTDHRRSRYAQRLRPLQQRRHRPGNRRSRHLVFFRPLAVSPVFGWPQATSDLATFYPTQLLVTGFDILFFWVARMIMLGCHFMLDAPMPDGSERTLQDAVPFREVYIHALVRDADRQKMSKTKGNVIDPIEIVKRFGTDAVRFTLAAMASPGTDIAFSEARTEGYRAFANKIWNAARFIFMNMERAAEVGLTVDPAKLLADPVLSPSSPIEARWIVSRLNTTAAEVNQALAEYRFDEAANIIYQFFWGDFCDWYLEIVKLRLDFNETADRNAAQSALATLIGVFESALRLLSPFMPFITEEIWHALYDQRAPAASIALTRYPQPAAEHIDTEFERNMTLLQELIVTLRALRKDLDVPEKEHVPAYFLSSNGVDRFLKSNDDIVKRLARISSLEPETSWSLASTNTRTTASFTTGLLYKKEIDVAAERERLTKELAKYEKELQSKQGQLSNEAFLAKAPANIVEGLRTRAAELTTLITKTRQDLDDLSSEL